MVDLDSVLASVREEYTPDGEAQLRVRRTLNAALAAGTAAAVTTTSATTSGATSGGAAVAGKAIAGGAAVSGAAASGSAAGPLAGGAIAGGAAVGGAKVAAVAAGASWMKLLSVVGLSVATAGGAVLVASMNSPAPDISSTAQSTVSNPNHEAALPRTDVEVSQRGPVDSVHAPQELPSDIDTQTDVRDAPRVTVVEEQDEPEAKTSAPPKRATTAHKASAKRASPAAAAGASEPNSTKLEELRLIREASVAIRAGRIADAHKALNEHRRRFPDSALSHERRGLTLLANCSGGVSSSTRSAAEKFVRGAPNSPLTPHVREQCLD